MCAVGKGWERQKDEEVKWKRAEWKEGCLQEEREGGGRSRRERRKSRDRRWLRIRVVRVP